MDPEIAPATQTHRLFDDLPRKTNGQRGDGAGSKESVGRAPALNQEVVMYCQRCGHSGATLQEGYYFCSKSCSEAFFRSSIAATLLGPGSSIISDSGQSFGAERAAAAQLQAHCWSCGKAIKASEERCTHCGKPQRN